MNKKLLLTTTIASAMFITGMSSSFALTQDQNVLDINDPEQKINNVYTHVYKTDWIGTGKKAIAIELDAGENSLTRETLVKLLEHSYSKGIVAKIVANGNEVTDANATVGTGATVTLQNGRELTVVLFGDVNGNGRLDSLDSYEALKHYGKKVTLSQAAIRAADVTATGDKGTEILNGLDSYELLKYYAALSAKTATNPVAVDPKVPTNESVVTNTLQIKSVSVADATKTNAISDGKTITVYGDFSAPISEILTINTGVACKALTAADGTNGFILSSNKLTLTATLDANTTKSVELVNANDNTEKLTVTVKTVDIKKPVVTNAVKANNEGNMALVEAVADRDENGYLNDTTPTTIDLSGNLTLMSKSTKKVDDEEVEGKFIGLELTLDNAQELSASGAAVEQVNGKTIVYVEAVEGSTTFKLRNVNAAVGQTAVEETYTVNFTSTSEFNLSDVTLTAVSGVTLVGSGDKYDAQVTVGTLTETEPTDPADSTKKLAKAKWYSVKVSIDNSNPVFSKIHVGKDNNDEKNYIVDNSDIASGNLTFYFKAEDGDRVITLRNEVADKADTQEIVEINLKLVDVTQATFTASKAVNASDATFANNMKAVKLSGTTANVYNFSTTPWKPASLKDEEGDTWYGLLVDTKVPRELLEIANADKKYVVTDSAELAKYGSTKNTEVLVWIEAKAGNATFAIYNKNDSAKDLDTPNLTLTTNLVSDFGSITVAPSASLTENDDLYQANSALLINNQLPAVGNKITYTIERNANALQLFEKDGVKGAWVPVEITSSLDTDKLVNCTYEKISGGVKVWIDVSKVGTTEVTLTKAGQSDATPEETVKVSIEVKDKGTMSLKGAKLPDIASLKTDVLVNAGGDIVKANQGAISNFVVDTENRKITFDFNKAKSQLNSDSEPAGDKTYPTVVFLVDTGVDRTQLNASLSDVSQNQIDGSADWATSKTEVTKWLRIAQQKADGSWMEAIKGDVITRTVTLATTAQDGVVFTVEIHVI